MMGLLFLLKWCVLITSNSENTKVHKEVKNKRVKHAKMFPLGWQLLKCTHVEKIR